MMIFFGGFAFAQNAPDYYPTSNTYDNGNYTDNDDAYYFPDDYYYEYPDDYYTSDFYNDSYNDYQRSISEINWNRFFIENRLSRRQVNLIINLNRAFPTFTVWNSHYHYNPDRWYYDRFYALQQILGPTTFVVFQNVYYHGYSPVVYYRNYRIKHYRPAVYVIPRYRNININIYKVDKHKYHENHGWSYNSRAGNGFRNEPRRNSNGSFSPNRNNGMRNTDGIRKSNSTNHPRTENPSGMRNPAQKDVKSESPSSRNKSSNGFRNSSEKRNIQPKNSSSERKLTPRYGKAMAGRKLVNR